ncbi:unnamed protein product [Heligmosomoides polygyrus]|uniref:G_PROTEIN_RECEP_F1_2 domain-containing protein n=1 Tax=Heligmosomoides polygyrus TaxID=6339 RepID=A0A183FS88_HELPZ|nr:unnamed protein product [Heligmosomoides polygyrus]
MLVQLLVGKSFAVQSGQKWLMRITWADRPHFVVKYYCGRKAAFGNSYASFIYGVNIVGYVVGFALTTVSSARQHLTRIRYQLLISVLSIVLISVPNFISLFAQYIGEVADAIAKPSTYLICANSAINIFVYIALYQEFRAEFARIVLRRSAYIVASVTITVSPKRSTNR